MSQAEIEQMLQQAEALLNQGKLQDARNIYSIICRLDPERPDAWLMFGVVNGELGQLSDAVISIQKAIRLQPKNPDAHVALAHLLCVSGNLLEARDHCLRATQLLPDYEQAWLILSAINGQLGEPVEAEMCARKTLEIRPDCAPAFVNLGNALIAQGRLDEAARALAQATRLEPQSRDAWLSLADLKVKSGDMTQAERCYRAVMEQEPGSHQALNGMGLVCLQQGRPMEALEWYRKSLTSNPGCADTLAQMGDAYLETGDLKNSIACYREAAKINPDAAAIHNRLGRALGKSGNLEEARIAFERALGLEPHLAESHLHLADLLRMKNAFDEACNHYRMALESDPGMVLAYESLGDLLQDHGKIDEACDYYRKALRFNGNNAIKIKLATVWPVILASTGHINDTRRNFIEAVDNLLIQSDLFVANPATDVNRTVFFPVYSGLDVLDIQLKVARLYKKAAPVLLYTSAHCQNPARTMRGAKIKLGIISRHFFSHTIGHTMAGLIEHLSRELFEVTVFTFPYESDPVAQRINSSADQVVILPKDWKDAHAIVSREEMDILFYTDVGMDAYTYFLAFARLAPVQCTTWGHAVTTGLGNMDYYLTCADFEPEWADEHYSEKLVRLSFPPTYYYRPQLPATAKSRAGYTWDAGKNLYLCPQTLFKFHPDFDHMIAGILRGDPNGQVVIISGREQHWLDLLFARFRTNIPDVVDRILVLQYPGPMEYLNLLHKCDVMLDTYHYGGGSTSLQGLALGTPIVTLPGNYQRGRHTYAYYRQMGFMECVATDPANYIEIAIRLGTDRDYRRSVSETILSRNGVLFENAAVVREIENFFIEARRF